MLIRQLKQLTALQVNQSMQVMQSLPTFCLLLSIAEKKKSYDLQEPAPSPEALFNRVCGFAI